jgi:hypothetical protein
MKKYKKTGKNIEVNKDELIQIVLDKVANYDNLVNSGDLSPNLPSPYDEPIFTKVSNGKLVQIPPDIQKEAITYWMNTINNMYETENNNNEEQENRIDHQNNYQDNYQETNTIRYNSEDPFILNSELANPDIVRTSQAYIPNNTYNENSYKMAPTDKYENYTNNYNDNYLITPNNNNYDNNSKNEEDGDIEDDEEEDEKEDEYENSTCNVNCNCDNTFRYIMIIIGLAILYCVYNNNKKEPNIIQHF